MEESLNARLACREREIRQSMDRQTDDRTKQDRAVVTRLRQWGDIGAGALAADCRAAANRIAALEGAALYASAELRHAYRNPDIIDRGLVSRAIKALERVTTPQPAKENAPRRHKTSCRAYSNYQPPYEECTCGAEGGRMTDPAEVNLYGCTPCPECGDTHRAFYHRSGLVVCDECGYSEPGLPPFGDEIEDPDGEDA